MYKLDLTKAVGKFLESLPPKQYRQVVGTILTLREIPDPHDAQPLKGAPQYQRVDRGEYRIIYRVAEDTVYVAIVGKRNDSEIYKQFKRLYR